MPRARTAKQCAACEMNDRVRTTFLTCARCQRYFCTEHGSHEFDRCFVCLEDDEQVE